jgi:hypothetical protein
MVAGEQKNVRLREVSHEESNVWCNSSDCDGDDDDDRNRHPFLTLTM